MNKAHKLQGFKTVIFNLVAIFASWLASEYGIELSDEHQTAVTVTIVSLANIGLRIITRTPICTNKDENEQKLLK